MSAHVVLITTQHYCLTSGQGAARLADARLPVRPDVAGRLGTLQQHPRASRQGGAVGWLMIGRTAACGRHRRWQCCPPPLPLFISTHQEHQWISHITTVALALPCSVCFPSKERASSSSSSGGGGRSWQTTCEGAVYSTSTSVAPGQNGSLSPPCTALCNSVTAPACCDL